MCVCVSVVKCLSEKFGYEFAAVLVIRVKTWWYAVPGDWTGKTEAKLVKFLSDRMFNTGSLPYQQIEDCAILCTMQLNIAAYRQYT